MERGAWTDERLDDRFDRIDSRFDQVDRRFDRLEGRIDSIEARLASEIRDLRMTMNRFGGGMMIALVGVIAAILARGV
jgi:DNA anti-recombination protein RmuC